MTKPALITAVAVVHLLSIAPVPAAPADEIYEVAYSLYRKGIYEQAEKLTRQSLKLDKDHSRAKKLLRRLESRKAEAAERERLEKAAQEKEAWQRVQRLIDAGNPKVTVVPGLQDDRTKRSESTAVSSVVPVKVYGPGESPKELADRARWLVSNGYPERALQVLGKVGPEIVNLRGGRLLYGKVETQVQARSAELQNAIDAAKSRPQDADVQFTLGYLLIDRQRFSEAADVFEKMLKQHPADSEAMVNLGYAYAQAGNVAKAEATYRKAMRVKVSAQVCNHLSYLLTLSGKKLKEGLSLALTAHDLSPDDPNIRHTLGYAYYVNGDLSNAHLHLGKAARASKSQEIQFHRALVLAETGDRRGASRVLKAIVKTNGDYAEQAREQLSRLMEK